MQVFMVQRSLKGIPMDDLAAAQQRAISKANEMTSAGTPVRYLRTTFAPESGLCMCLFTAGSAELVKKLNEEANIPFDKVHPAMDLMAP